MVDAEGTLDLIDAMHDQARRDFRKSREMLIKRYHRIPTEEEFYKNKRKIKEEEKWYYEVLHYFDGLKGLTYETAEKKLTEWVKEQEIEEFRNRMKSLLLM